LVALAVTLAPARATRLLERLEEEGAEEARHQAGLLATAPRRARLGALAAALAAPPEGVAPSRPLPDHPLLRRLELERRERPAVARTLVRPASGPRDDAPLLSATSRRHGP
jgi:hypothetical protein